MKSFTLCFPARYRAQVSTFQRIEALHYRLIKFLDCPVSDVTGEFYARLQRKAGSLIWSNSRLIIAMLENAIWLAQQGHDLAAIQTQILEHDYTTPNPLDVLLNSPYPDPSLWTIRDKQQKRL